MFNRDADTDELVYAGVIKDGQGDVDKLHDPRGLVVSPDGANVYVTSTTEDALTVFRRDVTAPETFIVSAPPAETSSTTATFDFSSNENNVTYECNLDGAGFVACTDPVTFTNLTEGTHTLQVRAIDQAGNTDPTPASYTWDIRFHVNEVPVVTSVTTNAANPGDIFVNETVTLTGLFTDGDVGDTHTATIVWGDGTTSEGTITGLQVTADHVYDQPGVYTVGLTVTDNQGGVSNTLTTTVHIEEEETSQDRVLTLTGTKKRDIVSIRKHGNQLDVYASFFSGNHRQSFDIDQFDRIHVSLLSGNDRVYIASNVHLPVLLDGGAGRDILQGGSGPNILLGGKGNDILIGGSNRDILIGGSGRDILIGSGNDDILIGGSTDHDENPDILNLALAVWTSDRTFDERMDPLHNSIFNEDTVDDEDRDILIGGSGRDWYFAKLGGRRRDILIGGRSFGVHGR